MGVAVRSGSSVGPSHGAWGCRRQSSIRSLAISIPEAVANSPCLIPFLRPSVYFWVREARPAQVQGAVHLGPARTDGHPVPRRGTRRCTCRGYSHCLLTAGQRVNMHAMKLVCGIHFISVLMSCLDVPRREFRAGPAAGSTSSCSTFAIVWQVCRPLGLLIVHGSLHLRRGNPRRVTPTDWLVRYWGWEGSLVAGGRTLQQCSYSSGPFITRSRKCGQG